MSDAGDYGGFGMSDGDLDADVARSDRSVAPGVSSQESRVVVNVESHGACNVYRKFLELAQAKGLVPIEMYLPPLTQEDRLEQKLLDWDAWVPPDDEKIMPASYYPGATGWTRLWKRYFQIGQRAHPWRVWEPLEPSFDQRTYLEIACVTWCYTEACDFHTHLVIKVVYLSVYDPRRCVSIYDGPAFDAHKQKADELGAELNQWLLQHPPVPQAKLVREAFRRRAAPLMPPPVVQGPVGPVPAAVQPAAAVPAGYPAPTPQSCQPSCPGEGNGSGADLCRILWGKRSWEFGR